MANMVRDLIEYSGLVGEIPSLPSPGCFKQLGIQKNLVIPESSPCIEKLVKVHTKINIKSTKTIDTPSAVSLSGQILTGAALVVEGEAIQKIEYSASGPSYPLSQSFFSIPFAAAIVLPAGFKTGAHVTVRAYVENAYAELLDKNIIFTSTDILLAAEI